MTVRFVGSWSRQHPAAFRAADVGGDLQVSEVWATAWQRRLDDGDTAVLTRHFYVVSSPEGRRVEQQIEFSICSDPAWPDSTETWSDGAYEQSAPIGSVTSLAALDALVRDAATRAMAPSAVESARFLVGAR